MIWFLYEDNGPVGAHGQQVTKATVPARCLIKCERSLVLELENRVARVQASRAGARITFLCDDEEDPIAEFKG
jgi:hypothetical protein